MASNTRINQTIQDWALKNAEQIDLRVIECSWPKLWLPNYSDIAVTLTLNNQLYEGRGTDISEDLAFIKALAEALERAVVVSNGLQNSNGMAAHTSPTLAKQNAAYELIERDWFLSHFYNQTALGIETSVFEVQRLLGSQFSQVFEWLDSIGVQLIFRSAQNPFYLPEFPACYPVMCMALGAKYNKPFGSLVTLGCKDNLSTSFESALLSLLRNLSTFSDGLMDSSLTIESFIKISKERTLGPTDHRRLSLDQEYTKKLLQWINKKPLQSASSIQEEVSKQPKIHFSEYLLDSAFDHPFVFYQALSPNLLSLHFGLNSSHLIPHPLS